jgi:hypothetical protein
LSHDQGVAHYRIAVDDAPLQADPRQQRLCLEHTQAVDLRDHHFVDAALDRGQRTLLLSAHLLESVAKGSHLMLQHRHSAWCRLIPASPLTCGNTLPRFLVTLRSGKFVASVTRP